MKITNVKMFEGEWGKTKAIVSVEFDKCFVVTGFKIIEGSNGFFVTMPNAKNSKGEYKDTCFPVTKEFREEIIKTILDKYSRVEDPKVFKDNDSSDSSDFDFPF